MIVGDPAAADSPPLLSIPVDRIFRWIVLAIVLLLIAHTIGQFAFHQLDMPNLKGFVPRTNMNGELSLPTLFATLLLGASASLAGLIGWTARNAGDPFARWWFVLAVILAAVMVDEAITMHEEAIAPLRDALGVTEGWLFFAWVIPAALIALLFFVVSIPFLRSLPSQTRNDLIFSAALIISGALGVEMIGGWYLSTRGDSFTYEMIGAIEETLELLGAAYLVRSLLGHLGRTSAELRFTLAP
jgi:hypothetical protein